MAEKPSVGQDLARVLTGPFQKHEGYLEGPDDVVTWAVGHLVQLAEPDAYNAKFKSWKMADLPIVPTRFKLVVRDERSRKQMSVITRQLARDDIEEVVNACDAGREGELIFAYLYEQAKGKKPVKRLWLNSMTNAAMKSALGALKPAEEFENLEEAARSRSEADWIVGMNATRAATIRLRSSFDGAVSLGRVQTPTLAIVARREEEIRAFKPEPYWLVDATFAAAPQNGGEDGRARLPRPVPRSRRTERAGARAADLEPGVRRGDRSRLQRAPGDDHQAGEERAARESADALRPDHAAARGEHPLRLLRPPHALRRPAPLRGAQGAHLSPHQLPLPHHRHGRGDQADRRARRIARSEYRAGRRVRRPAWTCSRWHAWSTTRRSPTTTRSSPPAPSTSSRRWTPTTAASSTWPRGASWPSSTPRPCSRTRAWRRPSTAPRRSARRARGSPSGPAARCCWCPAGGASTTRRP